MLAGRLLFCLLITPTILFARAEAGKDSVVVKYGFGNALSVGSPGFLADSGRLQRFTEIVKDSFRLPESKFLQLMNRPSDSFNYWIKFAVENRSDSTLQLYLFPGRTDYEDLYFLSPKRPVQHLSRGMLVKYDPGDALENEVMGTIPLTLRPRQKGTLFLSLEQRSNEYYFKEVMVLDRDHLNESFLQDYDTDTRFLFFQALFQGFLLCQLLYVLFQWLLIRRNEYLYYFFYLALIAVYFLSKYEPLFGIHLLFTKYPVLRIYLSKTLFVLPYFFYFRFVRSFLEMPVRYPALNRWIVPLEYFLLAYTVFDFIFIVTTFNQHVQTVISFYVLIPVFILAACFVAYMFRKRETLVYYIVTGSFFVGLGSITGTILTFLQESMHLDLGNLNIMIFPQVGVIVEICCFTVGLSYKSHASEEEKIRGQQELIEQLKANDRLQGRLQHIRNKIAQDLHDDIGSTLSSISILSDLAIKEKDSSQTLTTMSEINTHSVLLMERMDDIVWSINPKNDNLENLMMRVQHFATTLFEARNIDYDIRIQPQINGVKIPMEYRQHIYLILKEAINNLVKYSGATRAGIHIWFDDQKLSLEVTDNGCGFDAKVQHAGNGIYGMQNRAETMNASLRIRSEAGDGSRISLTVPFL